MRSLHISPGVLEKLSEKHKVTPKEINECFDNQCGIFLVDDRENRRTDPSTLWFVAETNKGRLLIIVFIYQDGQHQIKTAYEPNDVEIEIYERKGK